MKLDDDALAILAGGRIGMLSLHAGKQPLVNPAAYHFGDGSIWMTTSRYATKLALARRDPRAGFLVTVGSSSVLLLGTLETFDPLSVSGQLRAALQGPSFYMNLAGYALKNAGYVGGYLMDLTKIPSHWWPQNRVVIRLRAHRVVTQVAEPLPPLEAARLPGIPARLGRSLGKIGGGVACWLQGGYPVLSNVHWNVSRDEVFAIARAETPAPPAKPTVGAIVVESHHRFRATRMIGACLRGRIAADDEAREIVLRRYGLASESGFGLRLEPERVTTWSGFEVSTRALEAPVEAKTG
ncbi:MAG TPA: pyridoxamine 5'-phosphate oxidase family protein [Candidatus Dormibacteraeota bacterium]